MLLCLGQLVTNATTYYVSPSGNDANPGTITQPWQTMAKVNAYQSSLVAGDQVLFERGGTFRGFITLNASGTTGNQIVYGAYGTGAKPKILGSISLSGWTNIGGDTWTKNAGQQIGELFLNGKRQISARYPNTRYLKIESNNGQSSITHPSLSNLAPLNGGRLVVRATNDWIAQGEVTGQSGNTININIGGDNPVAANKGFYIDRVLSALDAAGEWYQDPSTFLITIKLPASTDANLQSFEGSVHQAGFTGAYKFNLIFENLSIQNYKNQGIRIANTSFTTVKNCSFKNMLQGVHFNGGDNNGTANLDDNMESTNIVIDSCSFVDNYSIALQLQWFRNISVTRNYAKKIAIVAGYEENDLNFGMGFYIQKIFKATISNNTIDSTGYSCMVWNGRQFTIINNEMSNNGLTKNDNGFVQAWGGETQNNLVKDNIFHDGFGNKDGVDGQDWEDRIGSAEGVYFDSFTNNNTITGNSVYNSKVGIFVQSSQNITTNNNTTYNCYWKGFMHHEFDQVTNSNQNQTALGWNAYITNCKTYNNIFYSVRPEQRSIHWSSSVCNSPFNFGTSDNNYIFNPYSTSLISQYNCPGSTEGLKFTKNQWTTLRGTEQNSKINTFAWNPYIISTTGTNLLSNGTFDTYINGGATNTNWYGNGSGGTANWENNPALNAGSFKAEQTSGIPDGFAIQSTPLSLEAGVQYVVSYSIMGNRDGNIRPVFLTEYNNYQELYSPGLTKFSTTRADYQFVFTAPSPLIVGRTYGLHFKMQANGDVVWLDNVAILKVSEIKPDDYLNRSKLFVNNQTTPQTYSLGSNIYKDLDGNFVCGNITVQPYKSKILILDESINLPTILGKGGVLCNNVQTTLTATGYTGAIQWQQSTDGQSWNNAIGVGSTSSIFITNTLGESTYFRVLTNSTVCPNLASAPYLVTLVGKGKITASKNPICEGETAVLSISGLSGNFIWRVSQNTSTWSDALFGTPNNESSYTIAGLSINNYFQVSVSGICGPIVSESILITVTPNATPSLYYWPQCIGTILSPTLSNSTGGVYATTTPGIILNTTTGNISASTITGNITINYRQNSTGGCPQKNIFTMFNLEPLPNISFQPNLTFCGNIPFTIFGTGVRVRNSWEANGFNSAKLSIVETASGVFLYEAASIVSNAGCSSRKNAVVTILPNPLPTITGAASLTYCQFANANVADITNKIAGSGLRFYSLSTGGTFTTTIASPITTNSGNPAYSIWVANSTGSCESPRQKLDIIVNPAFVASFSPNGSISFCTGSNVVLTSTSAINNQWYRNGQTILGANTNKYTATTAGIYNLKVGTGLCADTLTLGTKVDIIPLNAQPVFNYGIGRFCNSTPNIAPNTFAGISNGYFAASSGLFLNSVTGIINPNTLSGIFDISYIVPSQGGCANVSGMSTITIDGANPISTLSYTNTICKSATIASATGTNISGGVFSYSTSGANILYLNTTSGSINPSLSGLDNYKIIFIKTATGVCAFTTATSNVVINADDVATFSFPSATICNISPGEVLPNTATQTLGGTYSYINTGITSGILAIHTSTGIITPTLCGAGFYKINYKTNGTCTKSASFTMTVGTNPLTADFTFSGASFCANSANPQATGTIQTLSVISSSGIGTLVWADVTQGIVNAFSSGNNQTYHIKNVVSIADCGTDIKFADITINGNPNVSITGSAASVCMGNLVTLTGLGATNYTWLPSNTTGNINIVTPTNTNTITLTGTTNNCSATALFTVTVNSNPVISIATNLANKTICGGDMIVLTASGINYLAWKNNIKGNYKLIKSENTIISVNNSVVSVGNTIVGVGNTIVGVGNTIVSVGNPIVSGENPIVSVEYAIVSVDYAIITVVSGVSSFESPIFTISGYNANDCKAISTVDFTILPLPAAPVSSNRNSACINDPSFTLTTNGTNLKWYLSNTGGIGVANAPTIATTVTTTITSYVSQTINNCESNDRLAITTQIKEKPTVAILSNSDGICVGNQYTISATTTATGILLTYNWYVNNSTTGLNIPKLADINYDLPVGINNIKLTATPTETCGNITTISSEIIVITVTARPLQPDFQIINNTVCSDIGSISWINTSNLATAAWIITPTHAGINPNANGITIANNVAGFYEIIAINRARFCPNANSTFTGIYINPEPVFPTGLSYQLSEICSDRTGFLLPKNQNIPTGFSSTVAGLVDMSGKITFPTTVLGNVQISYTTSTLGCNPITTILSLIIHKSPNLTAISAENNGILCKSGLSPINVDGDKNGSFNVPKGIVLSNIFGEIDLLKSTKGNYKIEYTIAANGACEGKSAKTSISVFEPSSITLTAINFDAQGICEQNTATINISAHQNDNITWLQKTENALTWENATNFSNNSLQYTSGNLSETMQYKAVGVLTTCPNLSQTSNEIMVNVSFKSLVGKATATDAQPEDASSEICPDAPTTEIALESYRGTIQWYEAYKKDTSMYLSINANAVPSAKTDILTTPKDVLFNHVKYYKAKVQNGVCPAEFSNIVTIKTCIQNNFVPNALTPSISEKNSTWDLATLKLSDIAVLNVFNRYGTTIYESNGKELRSNPWDGSGLPAGTYYYTIDRKDGSILLTGDITIIK